MNHLLRLCGLALLFVLLPAAWAQPTKVAQIEIKHRGPLTVSDDFIRAHIHLKAGDSFDMPAYLQNAVNEDISTLYSTGLFYNIQVAETASAEGVVVAFIVQGNPRLVEIKFVGNTKYSNSKLLKKISSKVGEPLNDRKLFTDTQEIQKLYQKSGHPGTLVKEVPVVDEATGRATVTFEIHETPKVKILRVEFVGAHAFSQKKLRHQVKTRKHWMFSWITGHGFLKDEDLDEDKETLAEFYRDHGYIDFELKDVQIVNPTPRTMIVRFIVYEGTQYRVGSIKFTGNKTFSAAEITNGCKMVAEIRHWKYHLGPNGLPMDVGDVFTPKGMGTNIDAVEDFYGSKGYIDVTPGKNLVARRIPNTDTGTMDIDFQIEEGKKYSIEKIEIHGNTKTKDKVIRRELAVSPGETFDMLRVKMSKTRLEGLNYFDKVDTRAEPSYVQQAKNLVVGVDEKNTGNLSVGAGFSSVDALVGFAEVYQGNFDLFNPPTFTGGGQKFRLRVQLGTMRQDYLASFVEPWFLGKKLALGVDAYYRDLAYNSLGGIFDEIRAGGSVSLTRALGSDFLIGSVNYTLEDVGILLNSNSRGPFLTEVPGTGNEPPTFIPHPGNTPMAIAKENGYSLISKAGTSLAYDTRGGGMLPNKGQRTELVSVLAGGPFGGDKDFYKLEAHTAWYFKGLASGHVLELIGRTGVAQAYGSTDDVPFYERYYLGGLYSMRGFRYRSVSPREDSINEPIGGDTYWFGSAEYSIPIFEQGHGISVRFALFYDIGGVQLKPYSYALSNFDDNWGVGLRLNLPIGPLRFDYGVPIHHDRWNSGNGQFQFGVGYTREF
jgi:outer membrane protein insertion porin family